MSQSSEYLLLDGSEHDEKWTAPSQDRVYDDQPARPTWLRYVLVGCMAGAFAGVFALWFHDHALLAAAGPDTHFLRAMPSPFNKPGMLSECPSANGTTVVPCWVPLVEDAGDFVGSPSDILSAAFNATLEPQHVPQANSLMMRLRGRTVLVIGDSNDSILSVDFCSVLGGTHRTHSMTDPTAQGLKPQHDPLSCEVPQIDFRLVVHRNYGLGIEGNLWEAKYGKDTAPPYQFESRIDMIRHFMGLMERTPDLIIVNTNLWDLMHIGQTTESVGGNAFAPVHIRRYAQQAGDAIAYTREAFPGRPLMWRNLHPINEGTAKDFWNNRRREQLVQAADQISVDNAAPLLDIARLLRGQPTGLDVDDTILRDRIHMRLSPGLLLYSDVLLLSAAAAPRP